MLREAMALGVQFYRNIYVSHVINHSVGQADGASTRSYSEVAFYKEPLSSAPFSTPFEPEGVPMTIEADVVVTACGACIGTSRDAALRAMHTRGDGVAVKDYVL